MDDNKLITRIVPVKLSDEEILDRGQRVARLLEREDTLKTEAKDSAASYKEKIADNAAEIAKISRDIRNKTERREVECEKHYNYARGVIEIRRLDTRAVVEDHPMTPEQLRKGAEKKAPESLALRSVGA